MNKIKKKFIRVDNGNSGDAAGEVVINLDHIVWYEEHHGMSKLRLVSEPGFVYINVPPEELDELLGVEEHTHS